MAEILLYNRLKFTMNLSHSGKIRWDGNSTKSRRANNNSRQQILCVCSPLASFTMASMAASSALVPLVGLIFHTLHSLEQGCDIGNHHLHMGVIHKTHVTIFQYDPKFHECWTLKLTGRVRSWTGDYAACGRCHLAHAAWFAHVPYLLPSVMTGVSRAEPA